MEHITHRAFRAAPFIPAQRTPQRPGCPAWCDGSHPRDAAHQATIGSVLAVLDDGAGATVSLCKRTSGPTVELGLDTGGLRLTAREATRLAELLVKAVQASTD